MTLGPRMPAMLLALAAWVTLAGGCGYSAGEASVSAPEVTVTLGAAAGPSDAATPDAIAPTVIPVSGSDAAPTVSDSPTPLVESPSAPTPADSAPINTGAAEESRTFKVEGPENSIRISFDDVDLLKVMNLDPVPADAPERLPKWLKALEGKRIRVRGFMYPPFQDTDIRGFVLARDNQICCFGRTPKEYDLVDIFLRKGVTTYYIQNRPFDVVGVFHIKSEIEKYTAMYELEDAVVIEK